MFRLLLCLFGLHGASEVEYTIDGDQVIICRECLKEKKY